MSTPPPGDPRRIAEVCMRRGCPDIISALCAYVDRDGGHCATAWCENHLEYVADRPYCVRHTGIMRELAGTTIDGHRPPVGNRAASLVAWVANDMDQRVEWALQNVVDRTTGEEIVALGISYRFDEATGHHIWQRAWHVVEGTDVHLILSIEADEARDYEIGVRINDRVIAVTVPPWVRHHLDFEDIAADVDRAERVAFYSELADQIAQALAAVV